LWQTADKSNYILGVNPKKKKKKGGGAEKAPKILAEVCAVRVCFLVALFCWWRLSVVKSAMFLSIHVLPV
jgi:hypothetical protein